MPGLHINTQTLELDPQTLELEHLTVKSLIK